MDMKKMIQKMTEIENQEKTKKLNESMFDECGDTQMPAQQTNPGNPVTMSVTMNASGKEHVDDLLQMMKAAGLEKSKPVGPDMMPMRQDMDRLTSIMRQSEMESDELITDDEELEEAYVKTSKDAVDTLGNLRKIGKSIEQGRGEYDGNLAGMYANDVYDVVNWVESNLDTSDPKYKQIIAPVIELRKKAKSMELQPGSGKDARFGNEIVNTLYPLMSWIQNNAVGMSEEELEEYDNEPDEQYMSLPDGGGINRRKGAYAAAQDGDNAMAVNEKEADPLIIAKVQELSKINDIDVLKKEVYDFVKSTKMNNAKKMQLLRNTENSRTVKNLIGLLWNTFILGAEGKHAIGSSWGKRFEDSEEEMRESIKSQLLRSLKEKKAKPDFLDMDKDGNKKEPMKKAIKDRGGKAKKGKVPPQFKKKKGKANESNINEKGAFKNTMRAASIAAAGMMGQGADAQTSPQFSPEIQQMAAEIPEPTFLNPRELSAFEDRLNDWLQTRPWSYSIDRLAEMIDFLNRVGQRHVDQIPGGAAGSLMNWFDDNPGRDSVREGKNAIKDRGGKAKKGKVPPQFKKNESGINRAKKRIKEATLKDFKPKAVPGLYNFDHFEASDGSFIQVSPHGYGVYRDADGNRHEFNSIAELKKKFFSATENIVGEISSDLAKRYTKRAKMDRDFNDDELDRLPNKVRYGSDDDAKAASDRMSTLQRKNAKRQTGLNRAKKRM